MAIADEIVLDTSKYLKNLNAADRAAVKYATKQEQNYKKASESMQKLAAEIKALERVRDASNSTAAVKRYEAAIESLQREYNVLERETEEYTRAIRKSEQQTEKSSRNMSGSLQKIGKAAKQWIATIAVAAFAALQRASGKVASQFQDDFAQVKTLLNEADVDFEALERRLLNLSRIKAVPLSVLTPALYQTISAGITDVNEAMEVLSVASDAAIAGNTDLKTSADGITTALNAWNLEASEAKNVSDEFFVAVRNGKTTFGELSGSIGRVAPLAAATNTELSEILSATAALTSSGLDTTEAMTALRGILQKIIKPTEQAKKEAASLGIEFNQSMLEAKGLQEFLEYVSEAANGNSETIGKLFEDVEAFNGVLSLTGSASGAFIKNLDDMRGAAGETDEALSKVETNLSNIWELTKNKVNAALIQMGKTVLPMAGKALSAFNETLEEFEDPSQRLINNLEKIGADKELIVQLQAELDIKNATERYYQLEKELKDITVPIAFDVQSRMVTAAEAARSQGAMVAGQNRISIVSTEEIDVSTANVKELDQALANINNRLEEIGKGSSNFRELGKAQEEEMDVLVSSKDALEDVIAARKQQETLQTTIRGNYKALNALGKENKVVANENIITQTEATGKTQEFTRQIISGFVSASEGLGSFNSKFITTTDLFNNQASNAVKSYSQQITKLNNEYEAGLITQSEYQEKTSEATQKFSKQLKGIYKLVKDDLSPEQQEMWEDMLGLMGEVEDRGSKVKANFGDIADMVSGILSVADAIGKIDENLKNVLRGAIDVLRNLENIQRLKNAGEFSGINAALPILGVAGGLATILSGLFQGNQRDNAEALRQIEEMKDLRLSLKELQRAVVKNTEAYLGGPVVGGNISQEDYNRGESLFNSLFTGDRDRGGAPFGYANPEDFLAGLSELAELFPDIFGEFEQIYQNLRDQGLSHSEAVAQLMRKGLGESWSLIKDSFRDYGDSIEGAIKRYNDAITYGALSTQEAIELFKAQIEEGGFDLSQSVGGTTLENLIDQLASQDLSEEERESIIQTIWDNRESIMPDNVSFDDFSGFLDFLKNLENGSASGAGVTRNVAVSSAITEFSANEMIMLNEAMLLVDREQLNIEKQQLAELKNLVNGALSTPNTMNPILPPGPTTSPAGSNMFAFNGGINVSGGSLSDEDINQVIREVTRELKKIQRGRNF